MATRAQIRTEIRRDLRDPDAKTWSNEEINDLINSGIDAISDLSPIEVAESFEAVFPSFAGQNMGKSLEFTPVNKFTTVFRVDVLDSNLRFYETLPISTGNGWGNGWQWFAGKLHLPAAYSYPTFPLVVSGDTYERVNLKIWGYARHILLEEDSDESDMTDQEKNAVKIYVQAEALQRLMVDRADFQQWQIASGASDMTISELSVLASSARTRWRMETARIRKLRQLG